MSKHLVIPDLQCKPGGSTEHLRWLSKLIVGERPDTIINLGDTFDMPSLSSYDRGKKSMEGRRVKEDLEAGHAGLSALNLDLCLLQCNQRLHKKKVYKPRMVMLLGNHEERLLRHIESNAELDGILEYPEAFDLEYYGWEVHKFLAPVEIDGVHYAHYFYNPNSGRPYGGTAHAKLKSVGHSFIMGHQQGLDVANRTTNMGQQQWGIVAGSYYVHDEGYKGPQGNGHWRGVIILDNVKGGTFDPRFISIEAMEKMYGG